MEIIQKATSFTTSYNYALSQIFSPSLLKKLYDPFEVTSIKSLLEECNLYSKDKQCGFIEALESTYNYLKLNYRCEYVYKNEIANQLLLKYHNDNSATLLKEVNSDSSIADIVIINGNTSAYEIKTELDSFERLPSQINSYKTLYDCVYIVTYEKALKNLKNKIDSSVGIIVLDQNGILTEVRKASQNYDLFNSEKAGLTLRQSELILAYEKYIGKLPMMGTALIHSFCYRWFINLDRDDAHAIFYEALKSRKPSDHQFELIKHCAPALKMLFLGKDLSKKYCISLLDILSTFD
ncbi:MAG: sce7726 family protein [Mucilaginibacter sp.]